MTDEVLAVAAIIDYFVEEGLDPSYMSYEEIAAAAVAALVASGHLVPA